MANVTIRERTRALTPSRVLTKEESELLLRDDAKLLRAELRLERKKLTDAKERAVFDSVVEILLAIIRQPATGLIVGICLCELLERAGIFSSTMATIVEACLLTGTMVSAIGNAASGIIGRGASVAQQIF